MVTLAPVTIWPAASNTKPSTEDRHGGFGAGWLSLVGPGVWLAVAEGCTTGVSVPVGVPVGLGDAVGRGVPVGLGVGVLLAVGDAVEVAVGDAVEVAVGVGLAVGSAVGVEVTVGATVPDGVSRVGVISCGVPVGNWAMACPASRF